MFPHHTPVCWLSGQDWLANCDVWAIVKKAVKRFVHDRGQQGGRWMSSSVSLCPLLAGCLAAVSAAWWPQTSTSFQYFAKVDNRCQAIWANSPYLSLLAAFLLCSHERNSPLQLRCWWGHGHGHGHFYQYWGHDLQTSSQSSGCTLNVAADGDDFQSLMCIVSVVVLSITQQCQLLDVGADVVHQSTGLLWIPRVVGHHGGLWGHTIQWGCVVKKVLKILDNKWNIRILSSINDYINKCNISNELKSTFWNNKLDQSWLNTDVDNKHYLF